MTSVHLTRIANFEIAAAQVLGKVARIAEAQLGAAARREEGLTVARLRAFKLSVNALAAANTERAALWNTQASTDPQDSSTSTTTPTVSAQQPPDFSERLAQASSLADLLTIVDDAEAGCARALTAGIAEISSESLRSKLLQALVAIAEGLALTRAAIEEEMLPWSAIPE